MVRRGYFLTYAASWISGLANQPGKGGSITRRSFPTSCNSPCDLLAKPGLLGVCVSLTSTFQGQLFHRGLASARSYAPTAHRLPEQAVELPASCPSPIPSTRFAAHSWGDLRGWHEPTGQRVCGFRIANPNGTRTCDKLIVDRYSTSKIAVGVLVDASMPKTIITRRHHKF